MEPATIKLFLSYGDAKSLREAEISNWTGKAVAAPRTEFDDLLAHDELGRAGVYILIGTDLATDKTKAYIGEAEVIRDRIRDHKARDWVSVIVFFSKDENLTKAHVRYLESRLFEEAKRVGRAVLRQNQPGGARLPRSDREEMEVFFAKIQQLLPVLGFDLLVPIATASKSTPEEILHCSMKDAKAIGRRMKDRFVIFKGSSAVLKQRPSANRWPSVLVRRNELIADGTLKERDGVLVFMKDVEFSSPSAAAAVVHGGSANGLVAWRTKDGRELKALYEQT